jgi:hypothetical protein
MLGKLDKDGSIVILEFEYKAIIFVAGGLVDELNELLIVVVSAFAMGVFPGQGLHLEEPVVSCVEESPVLPAASEGDPGFSEGQPKIVNAGIVEGIGGGGELEVFDGTWEDVAAGVELDGQDEKEGQYDQFHQY